MSELLDMVSVLKAGRAEAIDQMLVEFEETLEAVRSGRIRGLTEDERERIEAAYERWKEEQYKYGWSDEPELDPEERRMMDRTGTTVKFADTPPETPETFRSYAHIMNILGPKVLAELNSKLSAADTAGAAELIAGLDPESLRGTAQEPELDGSGEDPFNLSE
ncbi:hypothetical protein M8R20_10570 [Pseudomonas sp. R2.Fl]|nr:hypothetical protein [Pseudomonas sp. R2.Fl]